MKTVSVSIENLCVPCRCACRHCLLSANHRSTGVDYHRGQAFAQQFYGWLNENRPDLDGIFYVGYCNDFPELQEHITFVRNLSPEFEFLQFNGLAFRTADEIRGLLTEIMKNGIRLIDLTFYGTREYHDRFAGRNGDFDFLLLILKTANQVGLPVAASIALTQENAGQMQALFDLLSKYQVSRCSVFLPHAKGRGASLSGQRITKDDFDRLPQMVKDHFVRVPHRTEAEWVSMESYPAAQARALTLALTPETIDRLESMDPADIIRELEELDDAYYSAVPAAGELAKLYGRPDNRQLFRFRDMYLQWQTRYLREHPIQTPNMNDERHSFSVRLYPEK